MIKVNLLPQKKVKRADKGEQALAAVFLGLVLGCLGVYFFIHAPLQQDVDQAQGQVNRLQGSIRKLSEETKDFDVVAKQIAAAEAQSLAIAALNAARVTPAGALHELANIVTKDRKPTMTDDMQQRVATDHNRALGPNWDPKRVWFDSFEERAGQFTLRGGAQSDGDITQLALRLQASVFFSNVVPEGGQQDRIQGLTMYRFTITGKVAY